MKHSQQSPHQWNPSWLANVIPRLFSWTLLFSSNPSSVSQRKYSRPAAYRHHNEEKLMCVHMHVWVHMCAHTCSQRNVNVWLLQMTPLATYTLQTNLYWKGNHYPKASKGLTWIHRASASSDWHPWKANARLCLSLLTQQSALMSSILIYFNFCLIKCIKELMCWIWVF